MDKDHAIQEPSPQRKEGRKPIGPEYNSIRKANDDASRVMKYAAVVLVLDADGRIIQEVRNDIRDPLTVRLIAVLAPAILYGVLIPQAIVFEIGFSRARPYQQLERRASDRQRLLSLTRRSRVRGLTKQEYQGIHVRLLEIMRDMVLARRESWKTKDPWEIGPKRIKKEVGISFSVHKSDVPAYVHLMLQEIRFRNTKSFVETGKFINRKLRRYRKAYSDKQFKQLKGVERVADRLEKGKNPSLFVREIIRYVDPRVRVLLARVLELFNIPFEEECEITRLVDSYASESYQSVEGLCFCQNRRRKRSKHGDGCFVIDGFLEKWYREKYEVPF